MRQARAMPRWIQPILLVALLAATNAQAVPLEVYGRLPHVEDTAISPDGSRIAFVKTEGNARFVTAISLRKNERLGGLRMGDDKFAPHRMGG